MILDELKLRRFLINRLRRASYMTGVHAKVKQKARIERGVYMCAKCEGKFKNGEIQIDHKKPIIDPAIGFAGWDSFIGNLFCSEEGLQVLCRPCHSIKSKKENAKRKRLSRKKEIRSSS